MLRYGLCRGAPGRRRGGLIRGCAVGDGVEFLDEELARQFRLGRVRRVGEQISCIENGLDGTGIATRVSQFRDLLVDQSGEFGIARIAAE